jgi:Protein of unknown function (DUF3990)
MSVPYPLYTPQQWTCQDAVLYHGTTEDVAKSIANKTYQINATAGSILTDFGQGFYTTSLFSQAATWAWQKGQWLGKSAAVLELEVSRIDLSNLKSLSFVRGGFLADDYWSFVFHCRSGVAKHKPDGSLFDMVVGPVAAFWWQRLAIFDVDQISFHTPAAENILNSPQTKKRVIKC